MYAPIVLFIYNRPDHTRQTLEALSNNTLASESDLFIYADGAKTGASAEQLDRIRQTRLIAHSKNWCKNVTVIESDTNKGLAASIISGVTEIVNKYGKIIVLEDDIVTGKYFLEFMNEALEKYADEKKVWHITGWREPIVNAKIEDSYFYPIMDCWGWATWDDRWHFFKKDCPYYQSIFTKDMIYHFNIEGSDKGMWAQIEGNASGEINTWAVFWYATLFINKGLCLAPTKSLVKNIGFDDSGEHCGENEEEKIVDSIDHQVTSWPQDIAINNEEYKKNIVFFKKLYAAVFRKRIIKKIKKIFKIHKH